MKREENAFTLTVAEAVSLSEDAGLKTNGLTLLPKASPGQKEREGARRELQSLDPKSRDELATALAAVTAPAKVVLVHYSLGAESAGRMMLAYSARRAGCYTAFQWQDGGLRLTLRAEEEWKSLVGALLAPKAAMREDRVRVPFSTEALLALVAILDHHRLSRLQSLIVHREPDSSFRPEDVKARLQEAPTEDFRWALLFLDKLTPLPIPELEVTKDPSRVLRELAEAQVVAPSLEGGYALTERGRFLAEAFLQEVSKVGLCVTEFRSDGTPASDVSFLMRTADNLFLFYLSGADAALITLGPVELEELLKVAFSPPLYSPPEPKPAPRVETLPAPPPAETTAPAERTVVWDETLEILPLCLVVETGGDVGKVYTLVKGGSLGRQVDNEIVLEDPGVSRKHASFTQGADGGWIATDLGSSNGTYVNDVRIQAPTPLKPGDTVRVSQTLFRFNPGPPGG